MVTPPTNHFEVYQVNPQDLQITYPYPIVVNMHLG